MKAMLPKKWNNLERQRPRLRWAKWGMGAGAILTLLGLVHVGSITLGLVVLIGSAIWSFTLLR